MGYYPKAFDLFESLLFKRLLFNILFKRLLMVDINSRWQEDCLRIRPFQSTDQTTAKHLILAGLEEHWGFLDATLNPDLDDIAAAYSHDIFLVAAVGNQIVGTGALICEEEGVARIVRMSVHINFRRKGIGCQILNTLCDEARQRGYRQITLETTETWKEAINFYQRNGFQVIETRDGDMHFLLDLGNSTERLSNNFTTNLSLHKI